MQVKKYRSCLSKRKSRYLVFFVERLFLSAVRHSIVTQIALQSMPANQSQLLIFQEKDKNVKTVNSTKQKNKILTN